MKYMILVSHGMFSDGLEDALQMLAGKRPEVLSIGLHDNESIEMFQIRITEHLPVFNSADEIIVLADLLGGSPLTSLLQVLEKRNMMEKTTVMGGMNLPLALTTVLMKDTLSKEALITTVMEEGKGAIKHFILELVEEEI